MQSLPEWAQWLQALGPLTTGLATVAVAIAVATITNRQANTAREKLVLDLFKDRVAVHAKVGAAIKLVIGPGRPRDQEPFRLLHEARSEARFLFGSEVHTYVDRLTKDVAALGLAHDVLTDIREGKNVSGDTDWPKVRHDSMIRISKAVDELSELMAPYMSMSQTLPGRQPMAAPVL